MRTTAHRRRPSCWRPTLSTPSTASTTRTHTSRGTSPTTDCCRRGASNTLAPGPCRMPHIADQRKRFDAAVVEVVSFALLAQGPGAAQADQGAVGGPDTDVARRAQRHAQVCVHPWGLTAQNSMCVSVPSLKLGISHVGLISDPKKCNIRKKSELTSSLWYKHFIKTIGLFCSSTSAIYEKVTVVHAPTQQVVIPLLLF